MSNCEVGYFNANLTIPFESDKHSNIAYNSLRVDPEPNKSNCTKSFKVDGENLIIEVKAKSLKQLRVSVNHILDLLLLVIETINKFQVE